jgi:peptidoglycan/LPS O-acetylase OafA/YrhL
MEASNLAGTKLAGKVRTLFGNGIGKLADDRNVDYLLILRGFAACGVVLSHMCGFGPHSLTSYVSRATGGDYIGHSQAHGVLLTVIAALTPIDATSFVIIFFVLSGYLMGKVFFNGQYQPIDGVATFYKARFLRLAPLLYFNLFACALLFSQADLDPVKLLGDIFFITNFTGRGVNMVTWSLSVEMQYYLVCPFVFLLFRRASRASVLGAFLLVLLLFVGQMKLDVMGYFFYTYTFVLGFSVNLVLKVFPGSIEERTKRLCIVGLIIPLQLTASFLHFMGYNQVSLFSASVFSFFLVYVAELPLKGGPGRNGTFESIALRFFTLAGVLSYGIYLWHFPILATWFATIDRVAVRVANALSLGGDWAILLMFYALEIPIIFSVTIGVAYTTFVLIETRFRPGLYKRVGTTRLNSGG